MICAVLAIGLVSCKKDETTGSTKTTSEKIIGKWFGNEVVTKIVAPPPIGNQETTDDISYLNVTFKSDGTLVSDSLGLDPQTGTWSAPSSSMFILDGDTFEIQSLTDSQFHFGVDSTFNFGGVSGSVSSSIKLKK